ncbi:hypothetical protein CYMTET_6039 [Cymbomonas tetramitiformis]|uniref:Uncharacterized protein n=1 Tax=Cymbomonas tetramitiformis TaxID=36881 RepID=A0AAE0LIA8_9CHLO|nr:hypothetical protein CYMTET_6039 [Cymbomonas tetramitiformis]
MRQLSTRPCCTTNVRQESQATIQQWTRECYAQNESAGHFPPSRETYSALALGPFAGKQDANDFKTIFSELRDQLFDMKKEIKLLNNRIDDTKGYTSRNDKKNAIGRGVDMVTGTVSVPRRYPKTVSGRNHMNVGDLRGSVPAWHMHDASVRELKT